MYVTTDTLYHHGIKGQRWGVRRFQNRDGSLTDAGRRRYDVDIEGAKQRIKDAKAMQRIAKRQYNKDTHYGISFDQKADNALTKANQRVRFRKDSLNNEKIKARLNRENSKSAHRLELEEYYRNKGMSDEEAAIAAYKRATTEKIIAGTAALGVAAAASYVVYRHYDRSVDKFINSGTLMKRVSTSDTASVRDAFYASKSKGDAKKYVGMYGSKLRKVSLSQGQNGDVFQKTINVKNDIKVASEKSGRRILEELVRNDPSYAKRLSSDLEEYGRGMIPLFNSTVRQERVVNKAVASLKEGKVNDSVYQALNLRLVSNKEIGKQFYDKLREKGYDAIDDINDKRLSGFGARTATIVFNPSKVSVSDVRKLSTTEIGANNIKQVLKTVVFAATPATAASLAAREGVERVITSMDQRDVVAEYKKKHPNTSLTYSEILDNYYKRK